MSAIRRVRVRTSSRAFIAAVRSSRSWSFRAAMDPSWPARAARAPGRRAPRQAAHRPRALGVGGRATAGMAPYVDASCPACPRRHGRRRRGRRRLRRHRRTELVHPAALRGSGPRPRRRPAAGPAPLRRAPDAGTAPAHVVDQVPGHPRPRPGREHRRLHRAQAGRPAVPGRPRAAARPPGGLRVRLERPVLADPEEPAALPVRIPRPGAPPAHPGPAVGRAGRGDDGGRLAGREQPARPGQGRGPGHRGGRGARLAHPSATATTTSPGPPTPPPTCGSASCTRPSRGSWTGSPRTVTTCCWPATPTAGRSALPGLRGPGHQLRHRPRAGPAACTGTRAEGEPGPARGCTSRRGLGTSPWAPVPVRLPAGGTLLTLVPRIG